VRDETAAHGARKLAAAFIQAAAALLVLRTQ